MTHMEIAAIQGTGSSCRVCIRQPDGHWGWTPADSIPDSACLIQEFRERKQTGPDRKRSGASSEKEQKGVEIPSDHLVVNEGDLVFAIPTRDIELVHCEPLAPPPPPERIHEIKEMITTNGRLRWEVAVGPDRLSRRISHAELKRTNLPLFLEYAKCLFDE
jgi:hypothetical protein